MAQQAEALDTATGQHLQVGGFGREIVQWSLNFVALEAFKTGTLPPINMEPDRESYKTSLSSSMLIGGRLSPQGKKERLGAQDWGLQVSKTPGFC